MKGLFDSGHIMVSYLNDLLLRAVAIEKEAFLTLTPAKRIDAVPRFYHVQEATPYITNRVSAMPIDTSDGNENEQFPLPRLTLRCVVGHITAAYKGENETHIYEWIPLLVDYFAERKWFQSAAYPAAPDYLILSEVVDGGGFRAFDNNGFAGTIQVGFEIVIACRFTEEITQVYL